MFWIGFEPFEMSVLDHRDGAASGDAERAIGIYPLLGHAPLSLFPMQPIGKAAAIPYYGPSLSPTG
jgi:hypothetical protein